jgi:hypothetical protein
METTMYFRSLFGPMKSGSEVRTPKAPSVIRPGSVRLNLVPLEDRLALSTTFSAIRVGSTLMITQTSSALSNWFELRIEDNPSVGKVTLKSYEIDGHGVTFVSVLGEFEANGRPNLAVHLTATDQTDVRYDLLSTRTGNVSLNIRNSLARELYLQGTGTIAGNLTVIGGKSDLIVYENGDGLHVGRNATFYGNAGNDILSLGVIGTHIGGKLTAIGFDAVGTNPGDKLGAVDFRNPKGLFASGLTLDGTTVTGGLTYVGGTKSDTVRIIGGIPTKLDGDVRINFGNQLAAEISLFELFDGSEIGGRLFVWGGALGVEQVAVDGTVKGNLSFNMGGGINEVDMTGSFLGSTIQYTGGSGVDDIDYSPHTGSTIARFIARLGDGADKVKLTSLSGEQRFAFIDFGAGTDTFDGTVNYSCQFLNLS